MPGTLKAQRVSAKGNYFEVPVDDLSGGLDLRKAQTLIKSNRARTLRNFSLRQPGALIVFPGYVSHSTGWSTSTEIFLPYDRDQVAIFDGATAAKKSTDGTTWTAFGIAAPGSAPTGVGVAGGSLTPGSTYEFSYTGRDDELLAESNESARVQVSPGGANGTIRLTLTKHADAQVDTLIVYARDVTAGEGIRRKVGTVANPAGATTTYDVTANTWGSGTEAPTDHTVPPTLSFGVVWKNRWWARDATVKNRLRFTQIFQAQSWPADFYIDIPFERGDDIAAVLPLGDTLVVWGQSKPFLVIGQTSLDFEVRPSGSAQAGALGARAVDSLEEGQVHASADGVFIFDGASDRLLSYDIDGFAPVAVGWRKYLTTASQSDLGKTAVVYHQASKEVAIAVTNLYPFGTAGEWILDLNRTRLQDVPAWTSTSREVGGYVKWDGNESTIGNRGRLFSWSQTIGKLYEERTGTTADGSDVVATYTGPTFAMGGRYAAIVDGAVEFEPHAGTLGIELKVDNKSLGSQNVDISGTSAVYDTDVYDTAVYDRASRIRKPIVFPLAAEGLTAEITATYTGQEAFQLFSYMLGIVPDVLASGF